MTDEEIENHVDPESPFRDVLMSWEGARWISGRIWSLINDLERQREAAVTELGKSFGLELLPTEDKYTLWNYLARREQLDDLTVGTLLGVAQDQITQFDKCFRRQLEIDRLSSLPYKEYLQSDHWKKTRERTLELDGERCRVCNGSNSLQVHHRTYRRKGRELPVDLITLCKSCHFTFHKNGKLAKDED
jgi:hypothetical protein